jgi:hypothetical protein
MNIRHARAIRTRPILFALFPLALFSMAAKGDGCQTSEEEPILPADAGPTATDSAVADSSAPDAGPTADAADASVVSLPPSLCTSVTSLDFVGTTSIPQNPAPKVNVTVTSAAAAQAACTTTLAQPAFPSGPVNCPADFGVAYEMTFRDASGAVLFTASADPNGCGLIVLNGGGTPLGSGGDFWSAIATDLGIAESTIYPYVPPGQ